MTMYARSDVVRIRPEGGCGIPHVRPVRKKDPDTGEVLSYIPIWGIDCPQCEAHLGADPQWSKSRFRIPLTPDELEELEEQRQLAEAALEQQRQMLAQQALAQTQTLRGAQPAIDPDDIAITKSGEGVEDGGDGTSPGAGQQAGARAEDYAALTKSELKDLARERGLTVGGTHADLVQRHVEFDNT